MSNSALTLVAVGDLAFNGQYHRLLKRHGPEYPFRHIAARWRDADLRIGNLESPITTAPRAASDKLTLRGTPIALESLRRVRFDCVSVANNHTMDFGPQGLLETCDRLRAAGIPFVGAGRDIDEALAPLVLEVRGARVGVLAFCDVVQISPLYACQGTPGVAPADLAMCLDRVQRLRREVDWLIVILHWGVELCRLPTPQQRQWARKLVGAGADLILGHHPHVLQPIEVIQGVPVAYSLGNFLFSESYWRGRHPGGGEFGGKQRVHRDCRKTGWLEVQFVRGAPVGFRFHPAWLDRRLVVVPRDAAPPQDGVAALGRILDAPDYNRAFDAEMAKAQQRSRWEEQWTPIHRRIELALFRWGLIPNACLEE